MRAFAFAALAAAASASFVELHSPALIPSGWKATEEKVSGDLMFHTVMIGMKRPAMGRVYELVEAAGNPKGPEYLNYLDHQQMGDLVRPPVENVRLVKNWLSRNGVTAVSEHPHGDSLKVKATAAQLESLTGGQFVTYEHNTGAKVFRITSGVNVPSEIAAVIDTFSGFNGFPLKPEVGAPLKSNPGVGACAGCVVDPPFLRKTYNISNVEKSGKSNIVAIAQFQGQYVSDNDLSSFCTDYDNGASCKIAKYIGQDNQRQPGVESMLDVEYIVPVSKTTSWVYSYPSFDFCSDLLTFTHDVITETEYAKTISVSYGSQKIDFCERDQINRFSDDITKLAGMGVTVLISSGDDGSGHQTRQGVNDGKLSPSFPASVPYAVAVGSTYFVSGKSGPEKATTQFGSGGGFSFDFNVPSYQSSDVTTYLANVPDKPTLKYANGRGSPDVSALGERYTVRRNGNDQAVGGTSASSPAFAGMVGLLNEECLRIAGKTLGFINPLFYQNPRAFNDVTEGTNAIGRNTQGWAATRGWDASTGLGTPRFDRLLSIVRQNCGNVAKRQ